jgi:Spy/CpxP family protein refolding chaperone
MKKVLLLTLILGALISTSANAQAGPDPAVMLQQMKDRVKPQMVEKTGLTPALADKVIELNFEMRMAASALRDLNEADRAKRIAELKATKEKKMSELLTPEQLKAVKAFYEDMARNAPPKSAN